MRLSAERVMKQKCRTIDRGSIGVLRYDNFAMCVCQSDQARVCGDER